MSIAGGRIGDHGSSLEEIAGLMRIVDEHAEAAREAAEASEMDPPAAWARAAEKRRRAREAVAVALLRALGGA